MYESARVLRVRALGVGVARPAMQLAFGASVLGCAAITGVDEYGVGCPSGQIADQGSCKAVPACAPDELPVLGGECRRVGVQDCGFQGFEDDPDVPGGCHAIVGECDRLYAWLGDRSCPAVPLASCPDEPAGSGNVPTVWVWADATEPFTGERDRPYRSIADAIAQHPEAEVVLVLPGRYEERGLVLTRALEIRGGCPKDTIITGPAGRPVIELGADADGSKVTQLTIQGAASSAGILVNGAEDVLVDFVYVYDIGGPGISFEDTEGATGGVVYNSVVEAATGAAVAAYGAGSAETRLKLDRVRITGTRPLKSGDQGYGIALHPSAILPPPDARNVWASHARPTYARIEGSIVQGGSGAGILIEGSDAEVDRTFVIGVAPQRDGLGRGIVVRPRLLGEIPASAVITRSVIESAYDAGIRVDNATATVEDTTIRSTGSRRSGEDGAAACMGNGIRARNNLAAAGSEPSLTLRRSVIDGALESGLHVEGMRALVEDSIVRNVSRDACGKLGDAVAAYGYEFSPAELVLKSSRIDAGPRTGVAAFAATVALDGSAVSGCGEAGSIIKALDARVTAPESSLCRCGSGWQRCRAASVEAAPALAAFGGCDGTAVACTRGCAVSFGIQGAAGLPNATFWAHERDDVASVVTDSNGCAIFPALPRGRGRFASGLASHVPALLSPGTALAGDRVGSFGALVPEFSAGLQDRLLPRDAPDLRNGVFVSLQLCQPLSAPLAVPEEVCMGRGVEGIAVELLGAAPPFSQPYYPPDAALSADLNRTFTSKQSVAWFYNVPPGEYRLALHHVDGRALDCRITDQGWGVPAEEPNQYVARVEPGWNNSVARLFCTLR